MKYASLMELMFAAERIPGRFESPVGGVVLPPDEIITSREFPVGYGGLLRAPRSELEALAALRDKYDAQIIVIDAPHCAFNYDPEENIPEAPKDRIEALMIVPKKGQNPRPKLDWPPAELVKLPHLHTLMWLGGDIDTLASGKCEITSKTGEKTVLYKEKAALEQFVGLAGDAVVGFDANVCLGNYSLAFSAHDLDAEGVDELNQLVGDSVLSGPAGKIAFNGRFDKALEQAMLLLEKDGCLPNAGRADYCMSSDGNTLKAYQLLLPLKHLYFIENNTKSIGDLAGFSTLRNLVLTDNKITGGLWSIVELIASGCLKQVDFSGNPLDLKGSTYSQMVDLHDYGLRIKGLPEGYKFLCFGEATDLSAAKAIEDKASAPKNDAGSALANIEALLDELGISPDQAEKPANNPPGDAK
jgi:hypothetical protein